MCLTRQGWRLVLYLRTIHFNVVFTGDISFSVFKVILKTIKPKKNCSSESDSEELRRHSFRAWPRAGSP